MRALACTLGLLALAAATAASCSRRRESCSEPYRSCEGGRGCGTGDTCRELEWPFGDGAACLRACESQLDCPRSNGREGRCLDVNRSGAFHCYASCGGDGECPSGWVCQPIVSPRGSGFVCLP